MISRAGSDLEKTLLNWVRTHRTHDAAVAEIGAETNLLEESVLDSVGFLDLITFLEGEIRKQVDLEQAAPDDLTSIRGLCRVASQLTDRG